MFFLTLAFPQDRHLEVNTSRGKASECWFTSAWRLSVPNTAVSLCRWESVFGAMTPNHGIVSRAEVSRCNGGTPQHGVLNQMEIYFSVTLPLRQEWFRGWWGDLHSDHGLHSWVQSSHCVIDNRKEMSIHQLFKDKIQNWHKLSQITSH